MGVACRPGVPSSCSSDSSPSTNSVCAKKNEFGTHSSAVCCSPPTAAAVLLLMSDKLPPAVKEQLLHAFTVLDREHTGSLNVRDITRLMNGMLNSNLDELTLAEIMSEVCDSDAPGVAIDFESFCKAIAPALTSCSEEELSKRAFAAMDADGSGCISAAELRPLMSAVAGTRMSQQQTTDVLALAAGKDGKVRYDDYVKVTKGT